MRPHAFTILKESIVTLVLIESLFTTSLMIHTAISVKKAMTLTLEAKKFLVFLKSIRRLLILSSKNDQKHLNFNNLNNAIAVVASQMKFKDLVDSYKPIKQEISGFTMMDNSSPVEATWDFSSTNIPDVLKAVPIDAKPEDFKRRLIKRTFVSDL